MFARLDDSDGARVFTVSGSLTIYEAAEAKAALLALVDETNAQAYVLNASGLDEVDCAGVQLLLAFQAHLAAAGSTLCLAEPAEGLIDLLALLRLEDRLPTQGRGITHV